MLASISRECRALKPTDILVKTCCGCCPRATCHELVSLLVHLVRDPTMI